MDVGFGRSSRIAPADLNIPILFPTPRRFLAACYAHMGLLDEARATVERLRALTPEVIPTYPLPFHDPAHRELYYTGLRLALGEDTAPRGAAQPGSELSRPPN